MSDGIPQKVEEIITEIDMSRDQSRWLIVEGVSDETFFFARSLPRHPVLRVAEGWENVVKIIQKIKDEHISSLVIGFVDRDYREELGIEIDETCIVVTDFRDLEISIFESKALDSILAEYASMSKIPISDNNSIDVKTIRKAVYDIASQLGKIRFFSLECQYYYSFPEDIVEKVFDKKHLCLHLDKLSVQINLQGQNKIDDTQLKEIFCANLPSRLKDERNLCCGHDVIAVFSMFLRYSWRKGNISAKAVDNEQITKLFRIGYSDAEFQQTSMGQKLISLLQ